MRGRRIDVELVGDAARVPVCTGCTRHAIRFDCPKHRAGYDVGARYAESYPRWLAGVLLAAVAWVVLLSAAALVVGIVPVLTGGGSS